ncbi:MAG TPA: fumarylacetoacetate hydrolase family protein, partial [Chloroflexota bacterium]|nr:fumarylacetoacetate hydrolase family protein [Chloroflexota bacterium]
TGTATLAPEEWQVEQTRHLWTVFGNDVGAEAREGMVRRPYVRVLAAPASALSTSGREVRLPERARTISAGPELAFVVGQVASGVPEEQAEAYIAGYLAMAGLRDSSFAELVSEPASLQERSSPGMYARWADGFNVVSETPIALPATEARGRRMTLTIDGYGVAEGNTDEYVQLAPRALAFLSQWITVFPGDVVTLGRIGAEIQVPADAQVPNGTSGTVEVAGIGRATFTLADHRGRETRET